MAARGPGTTLHFVQRPHHHQLERNAHALRSHCARPASAASSTSLECSSFTETSLSSLAARLPDHPSRCKRSRAGHESATGRLVYFTKSRRPQANWCSRCRADKFVLMDRIWIFLSSNFSIVDSLAGSRTCRYHTVIVRRCAPSHLVGRDTITREMLSC